MRYPIFFIAITLLTSCDSTMQGNSAMREDVAKTVQHFCKSQQKQIEISQKMSEYKEKGQIPDEQVNVDIDEVNKHMEAYTNALQALMEKYKGQERTVYNLLKKEQLNCK